MNKTEVVKQVSIRSGIDAKECEIVLNVFEEVLTEELTSESWKGSLFEKVYAIMGYINNKRS